MTPEELHDQLQSAVLIRMALAMHSENSFEVRHCQNDIWTLQRHGLDRDSARCVSCMQWCLCPDGTMVQDCACRGNEPWPCETIRDLAYVYELGDPVEPDEVRLLEYPQGGGKILRPKEGS